MFDDILNTNTDLYQIQRDLTEMFVKINQPIPISELFKIVKEYFIKYHYETPEVQYVATRKTESVVVTFRGHKMTFAL